MSESGSYRTARDEILSRTTWPPRGCIRTVAVAARCVGILRAFLEVLEVLDEAQLLSCLRIRRSVPNLRLAAVIVCVQPPRSGVVGDYGPTENESNSLLSLEMRIFNTFSSFCKCIRLSVGPQIDCITDSASISSLLGRIFITLLDHEDRVCESARQADEKEVQGALAYSMTWVRAG